TITVTATAPNDPIPTTYSAPGDNLATISGAAAGPVDPLTTNNTARRTVQVSPDGAVDLAFTKSKSPNPVAIGSPITSTFRITNALGPYPAQIGSVTLTDVLNDDQESYLGASGPWNCSVTPGAPTAGQSSV